MEEVARSEPARPGDPARPASATTRPEAPPTQRPAPIVWLDVVLFAGFWVASAAAALAVAAGVALGSAPPLGVVAVVWLGTFAVYGVDRIRDLERDRHTRPARTAFVERHRSWLGPVAVLSGSLATALGLTLGSSSLALLAAAGILGFWHRRLKTVPLVKGVYVSLAWLAVTVGLPAVAAGPPSQLPWVLAIAGATLLANATASNLPERESATAVLGPQRALRLAQGLAVLATLVAWWAPAEVRPLGAIALATWLALVPLRHYARSERYGLLVVDGALLVGAVASSLASGMS